MVARHQHKYDDAHWARLESAWLTMSKGGKGRPYLPESERLWAWTQHTRLVRRLLATKYKAARISPQHDHLTPHQGGWVFNADRRSNSLEADRLEYLMGFLYSDHGNKSLALVTSLLKRKFWVLMAGFDAARKGVGVPLWPDPRSLKVGTRLVDYYWVRNHLRAQFGVDPTLAQMLEWNASLGPTERPPSEVRYRSPVKLSSLWGVLIAHNV